jgi:hypothetical protein
MKPILILIVCICACFGKDVQLDPLVNTRHFYISGIDIRLVNNVRYCTVKVEVSKQFLDALCKRNAGPMVPCLVLRTKAPGLIGLPVNPRSFQLRSSTRPAWLDGHVAYEVTLTYDYLYGGTIDIQSMAFEMMPTQRVDRLDLSDSI